MSFLRSQASTALMRKWCLGRWLRPGSKTRQLGSATFFTAKFHCHDTPGRTLSIDLRQGSLLSSSDKAGKTEKNAKPPETSPSPSKTMVACVVTHTVSVALLFNLIQFDVQSKHFQPATAKAPAVTFASLYISSEGRVGLCTTFTAVVTDTGFKVRVLKPS